MGLNPVKKEHQQDDLPTSTSLKMKARISPHSRNIRSGSTSSRAGFRRPRKKSMRRHAAKRKSLKRLENRPKSIENGLAK
jgi:hypothetical protein